MESQQPGKTIVTLAETVRNQMSPPFTEIT